MLGDTVLNAGDVITFTGSVGVFKTDLQLRNTAASEIVVTSSVTPPDPGDGDTFGLASTIADNVKHRLNLLSMAGPLSPAGII